MKSLSSIAIAVGLALAGAAYAAPVTDAAAVRAALQSAGYAEVRDIDREEGYWEAEVRGADGRWHDVHVVAESGHVLDPAGGGSWLTAQDVRSLLEQAGYSDVHDLDRDGGLWEVDATSPDGVHVDLVVAGDDGSIIASEPDDD